MKLLVVTEKCSPNLMQRDGGARLVDTLRKGFGDAIHIMQFGGLTDSIATWRFDYPVHLPNRFKQRLANAVFIAEKVKEVAYPFTHIAFIHVSMQFGLVDRPLPADIETWTFPMFLTPAYQASGEKVPTKYTELECLTLAHTHHIITPSYLEKKQLIDFYAIKAEKIHVIPRGIDTSCLIPKVRFYNKGPLLCNVASIKPQKNTLGLIHLFAKIKKRFPEARLNIIGPVQDQAYDHAVQKEVATLDLHNSITCKGYVAPIYLADAIQDAHIHLVTSHCETFGRSIFETLASGIPNVVLFKNNAAAEFLSHLPYVQFVEHEAVDAIEQMLTHLPSLSEMALEIGNLYGTELLDRLLVARIQRKETIAISDFDGTLLHKKDITRTSSSLLHFQQFTTKIICSARTLPDLLQQIQANHLKVDWIIAYSGAVIADGKGNILFITAMDEAAIYKIALKVPEAHVIRIAGKVVQMAMPVNVLPAIDGLHVEIYQDTAFVASWQASKLRAIHKLLSHIKWCGRVEAFGDSKYDKEFLTYFDGKFVQAN